ncbi:hypothetical protein [Kineococcus rubinsiae]|uniref:hypothetical protein n=1 Tax=Kineococcus rubinsiae TaxID=2609562 RepID=UPI0014321DDB|nr:hypothetical protein [Kineococcus rubinsiae]NIZ93488.1 hypothetical protein [Kineococcus rubinsiae]
MSSSRPSLAACLVLHASTPSLGADVRALVGVADEVVVYDTADHLKPGSPAFEATLHPAVTVVSGFWADDSERAREAALAHVAADWALCVLSGEQVTSAPEELRRLLVDAADAPALSVRVDDVVRGTHRSARLLHTSLRGTSFDGDLDGDLAEVPSRLLSVCQPASAVALLPRQRGVFSVV